MSSFASLLEQEILTVPSFTLECGRTLREVPVAYKTWGTLNETRDNVMIVCHAFTGSADVVDWWGPLMGRGKAFDPNRYFIFCANTLGSPYGTASPVTVNPDTGRLYGPEFPATTIRDDVRLHKLVLDHLRVTSVAVAIGGSMGGMAVLEWPLCSPPGYVRHIIPIATSARNSAWCISWGETQRQSIYSDPAYEDGFYTVQPTSGLAAARMAALLTYRSRDSFESRFGRKPQKSLQSGPLSPITNSVSSSSIDEHNDGNRYSKRRTDSSPSTPTTESLPTTPRSASPHAHAHPQQSRKPIFSAQSYLRYQGDKFSARFDANCYIHITRKMDSHDVSRDRLLSTPTSEEDELAALARVLSTLPPRALVIGIQSDGLFLPSEQREIAQHVPGAQLVIVPSPEGHDGFLLEFESINKHILGYLKRELTALYGDLVDEKGEVGEESVEEGFGVKKTSTFGEAEVDFTMW